MNTFLFTWNPDKMTSFDVAAEQRRIREQGFVRLQWSCSNSKRIRIGDRAFLMRLRREPKGIIGSGVVVKERYEDLHYDPEPARKGKTKSYVDVRFDVLRDPEHDDFPRLKRLPCNTTFTIKNWTPESSGNSIPEEIAEQLECIWAEITAKEEPVLLPEEIDKSTSLVEGASRRILVNRYERDPEARRQCIDHYGTRCAVCGHDFGAAYGTVGVGFIHVHHLRPLATIGSAYEVDPIADLRPVCPNCHAIIHRRSPPYTLEEVRSFLASGEESSGQ